MDFKKFNPKLMPLAELFFDLTKISNSDRHQNCFFYVVVLKLRLYFIAHFYPSLTFCLTNWLSYYISDIDDGLLFYWYSLTRPQIPKQRRKRSCYWFSKSSRGPSYSVRQTSQRLFSECVIIISNEAELSSRPEGQGGYQTFWSCSFTSCNW